MKNWTISKRFVATTLSILLVCGAGLVSLAKLNQREAADLEQFRRLGVTAERIRYQMIVMSDAMRGTLLNPTNSAEFQRKLEADKGLTSAVEEIQKDVKNAPNVAKALEAVGKFDAETLNPLENKVMELITTDAKAASEYYFSTYLPARVELNRLVDDFLSKANHHANSESHRYQRLATFLMVASAVALVICILVALGALRSINTVLRTSVGALGETSYHVSASATEVSAASQTLAEGASEQAAALEETSASLEELTSMVRRNAENAQKAKEIARETRSAADQGGIDMEAMKEAMNAIKASSDDVAKIVKNIDEIAFQTNILALNAAVEAARAGEAGAGFAVVADEVRNLAQRSAQAAKETASKIEDAIGKSEHGVVVSGKVALSLQQIVEKTRAVDELVASIAGASKEQSLGIDQISTAIHQMDKVTQSNAAGAEESASASRELNSQAAAQKAAVATLSRLVGGRSESSGTTTPAGGGTSHRRSAPSGRNGTASPGNGPKVLKSAAATGRGVPAANGRKAADAKPVGGVELILGEENPASESEAGDASGGNGNGNGKGHAAQVTSARSVRDRIPMEGDFKDF